MCAVGRNASTINTTVTKGGIVVSKQNGEAAIVAAENVRSVPWPVSRRRVRVLQIDGMLWCVAADLCWALGLELSSNGRPNVTMALRYVDAEHRRFAKLEVAPGTFRPYCRYALIAVVGATALVGRKRIASNVGAVCEADLFNWIAEALAAVANSDDMEAEPPASHHQQALRAA
jgi:hypothetical protein